MHAHLRTADHEGVAHVEARIAHIDEMDAVERAEMLPDGQEVREDLRRVKLVRQAVPDRDGGVLRQLLDDALAVAAVFDAVEHAREHTRGVGDALLLADLRAGGVEIRAAHAQIVRRDLEAAARARARLFKDERDVFALAQAVRDAGLFFGLELGCDLQQVVDLLGAVVEQLEKIVALEIHIGVPPYTSAQTALSTPIACSSCAMGMLSAGSRRTLFFAEMTSTPCSAQAQMTSATGARSPRRASGRAP